MLVTALSQLEHHFQAYYACYKKMPVYWVVRPELAQQAAKEIADLRRDGMVLLASDDVCGINSHNVVVHYRDDLPGQAYDRLLVRGVELHVVGLR